MNRFHLAAAALCALTACDRIGFQPSLDRDGLPEVDAGAEGPDAGEPDAGLTVPLTGACARRDGGLSSDGGGFSDGGEDLLPPQAFDLSVVSPVPSDFDPTANPTTTTTIQFTLMLPARCPGDRFPLILQSHGYGGSRETAIAADGGLFPEANHFDSINRLVRALPHHGYAVISYDERGHGTAAPQQSPHRARIIDPGAETQDAVALLDWAHANAEQYGILTEDATTGIPKDVRVGTIGYSYGGGFQMPLAALDRRVDTIVPIGTWNNLLYSLVPGDAVKLSFGGLLCTLAQSGNVNNTPLVQTMCNLIGPTGLNASNLRTHADLAGAASGAGATPRPVPQQEFDEFFYKHGMGYFENQQDRALPWGFGETNATLRPVSALFVQGNRDVLFNLTEAYRNYRYFKAAGGDVRLFSTEGGHMNPFANQVEGSANCGGVVGVEAIFGWFEAKLKGRITPAYSALPPVCISVTKTVAANVQPTNPTLVGVTLPDFPVGSVQGPGAVAAFQGALDASVPANAAGPVFLPVGTLPVDGGVLAGVPRIESLVVSANGGTRTPIAFVGVGVRRADGGQLVLVDDEVTPFAEGEHVNNRGTDNLAIFLPAVGEVLEAGDQVGLLLYEKHPQFSAVVSAGNAPGATNVVNTVLGTSIPPIAGGVDTSGLNPANPYTVSFVNVALPIFLPGQYPGSAWSRPAVDSGSPDGGP